MNKKNLSILVTSTILSCGIGGFVVNPQKVEAKELKVEQKQNIKPEASSNNSEAGKSEVESKDIVKDTLDMLKETKTIYYTYYYKFDKNFKQEIKDPAEYTYVYEKEIKNLQHNPEELEKYCKTNPKIIKLWEVNKRLKEEAKKITESKKAEEKKPDVSKPETPSNPDTGKTQAKPEEKKTEVESKDIVEDTLNMFKEIKQIYHIYKFKADFNKDIIKKFKDPVEYIYVYENEMKKLKYEPEKLKEYCKTNPKINELREIHKILKEERKKYDESKKAEEKKPDVSKPETPSNPDTGKPQVKLEEKKPEVDVKQNEEKPDVKHDNKNTEKELNKDELNKSKPNEISMVKKENNKNVITDQSKVMNSIENKAETKKVKDVPKTGEASSLPYVGGLLISLAAFLKLNMKKFKKN